MTLLARADRHEGGAGDGRQRHPPQLALGDLWGSVRTSSGELVGIDSALRIVTVYACVRVLAETVASP